MQDLALLRAALEVIAATLRTFLGKLRGLAVFRVVELHPRHFRQGQRFDERGLFQFKTAAKKHAGTACLFLGDVGGSFLRHDMNHHQTRADATDTVLQKKDRDHQQTGPHREQRRGEEKLVPLPLRREHEEIHRPDEDTEDDEENDRLPGCKAARAE